MDYPEGYEGRINLRAGVNDTSDTRGYSIYLSEGGEIRTVLRTYPAEVSMEIRSTKTDDEIALSEVPQEVLSKFQRQLELFDHESVLDESQKQGIDVSEVVVEVTFNEYTVHERDGYYGAKKNGDEVDSDDLPADVREYSEWLIDPEKI